MVDYSSEAVLEVVAHKVVVLEVVAHKVDYSWEVDLVEDYSSEAVLEVVAHKVVDLVEDYS